MLEWKQSLWGIFLGHPLVLRYMESLTCENLFFLSALHIPICHYGWAETLPNKFLVVISLVAHVHCSLISYYSKYDLYLIYVYSILTRRGIWGRGVLGMLKHPLDIDLEVLAPLDFEEKPPRVNYCDLTRQDSWHRFILWGF